MPWQPYHHDWKLAYQTALGLRVHWFGRYAGYPEWSVPPSRHTGDMVSFFFVEKNSCWVQMNGRKLLLQTGDLLIMTAADKFCFGHDPEVPHVSISASLALEQDSIANTLLRRKFARKYAWPNPAAYTVEFNRVLHAFASTSPYRDLEIAGALLRWLAYVLAHLNAPLDTTLNHEHRAVDKILTAEAWVDARLRQEVSLAEWAQAVGLSPVYFGRLFKRETGLRPMAWLNQRRLQMASQYLSSTSQTVGEIAALCGFADQFYFSRVFRKHFGQPPLQYRKTGLTTLPLGMAGAGP